MKQTQKNFAILGIAALLLFLFGGSSFFSIVGNVGAKDGSEFVKLIGGRYQYGEPITFAFTTGNNITLIEDGMQGKSPYATYGAMHISTVDLYNLKIGVDGIDIVSGVANPDASRAYDILPQTVLQKKSGTCSVMAGNQYDRAYINPAVQLCYFKSYTTGTTAYPTKNQTIKLNEEVAKFAMPQYLKPGNHTITFFWKGDNVWGGNSPNDESFYISAILNPRSCGSPYQCAYEQQYFVKYTFEVLPATLTCTDENGICGDVQQKCYPGQERYGQYCIYEKAGTDQTKIVYVNNTVEVIKTVETTKEVEVIKTIENTITKTDPLLIVGGVIFGGLVVFGAMKMFIKRKK